MPRNQRAVTSRYLPAALGLFVLGAAACGSSGGGDTPSGAAGSGGNSAGRAGAGGTGSGATAGAGGVSAVGAGGTAISGSAGAGGKTGSGAGGVAGGAATGSGGNATAGAGGVVSGAGGGGLSGSAGGSAAGAAGHSSTGGGGTAAGGSGGKSGPGGAGGTTGGTTPDAGASPDSGSPTTPPASDKSSTLGISAPGSGYHVDGNIPYGPFVMQRLDVIYPNGAGPGGTTTLPGVIMFHGGGWTDNRPQALKASMSSFFSRFLKHGFIVCNVEYRLADGTANGAIAPAADQDALLAAQWFWSYMDYYHVDKTRYVVTGASAGGQLALMVGMATPAAQLGPTSPTDYKIAAIVNGYGPSDVTDLLARNVSFAEQWLPASVPNRAALAKVVSPVTYVRQDVPPLITVQGMDDTTVPTAESQNLYNLLTAAGADTALHFVAGAGHGFDTPATAWPDAEAAMFNFLVAHGIGK
jgi:acetyl esterase/lipase